MAVILSIVTIVSTISVLSLPTYATDSVFNDVVASDSKCNGNSKHSWRICEASKYYAGADIDKEKQAVDYNEKNETCASNYNALYICSDCYKFSIQPTAPLAHQYYYDSANDNFKCKVCGGTSDFKVSLSSTKMHYGRNDQPSVVSVSDNDNNIIDSSDYCVWYIDNDGRNIENGYNYPGKYYVIIEGDSDAFNQKLYVPYTIEKIDGSELKLKLSKKNYKYTGKNIRPDENDLSLVDANDCEISSYENYKLVYPSESKNVGTYTVTAKFYNDSVLYKGSTSTTYTVYSSDTDGLSLSLSSTKYYYNGKVQKPSVRVLDSKGNAISSSNYNVRYSNANSAALGTYNVTVDFKGNYTGKSITRAYTIAKIPAKKCKVSLSSTSYTYNKKSKKPSVTVKYGKTTLKNKKDYTVSYSKGRKNAGIYFATVKFKGYYEGTTKKSFQIRPKGTKIDKITAGNKKLTIKVKKQSKQISGYQIQYSNTKSFKKNINNPNIKVKNITFGKSKNNSKKRTKTAKNLFGKETYYVRARTYKEVKVDGKKKKVYSKWSKAKKITTKGKKSKKTKYTVLIKNKLLKDDKGNYRICNQSVRDNQRGTGMYYGIPDEPTIMVSDAYSNKEYNDYLKRLYKVYKSINIKSDMSDVQKFTLFLKWTNNKLRYNKDYYNNKAGKDSGTCGYSALKKGKAVCAGYSEIINDLCYLADLPCYILESDSGNHAWNLVKLNGYWYNINTTSSTTYYSWRYVAYGDNLENDNRTVNLDYIAGYLDYERCTSGTFRKTFFNNRCKMATEDTAKKLSKDFYDSIVFAEHYKFK